MVMARLHIICGNCGAPSSDITYRYVEADDDTEQPEVFLHCKNCATLHVLSDTVELQDDKG